MLHSIFDQDNDNSEYINFWKIIRGEFNGLVEPHCSIKSKLVLLWSCRWVFKKKKNNKQSKKKIVQ